MTAHSCEKCINTDVGLGEGEDGWEGILGSDGWLTRCVSLAEPTALRVVTQFLLLSLTDCYRLGRACRAHRTAVLSPKPEQTQQPLG